MCRQEEKRCLHGGQQDARKLGGSPRRRVEFDEEALERRAVRFFVGLFVILLVGLVVGVVLWL